MWLSFTLSRYLSKTFLHWFVIFLIGIIGVVILFDFSELLRRSVAKTDVSMKILLEMVFLRLPYLMQQILPFVVLFSTMFAFWRLNRHNEVIVARGAGISIWQMLFPMLTSAFVIGLFDLGVMNPIAATMMERYDFLNKQNFHHEKSGIAISEGGIWVRQVTKKGPVVFRAGHVDSNRGILFDVTILEFKDRDAFQARIEAQKASFKEGGLNLKNVWRIDAMKTPEYHQEIFYPTSITLSYLQESNKSPENLSFWSLLSYSSLMEKSGLSGLKYQLYWHALLARAFWLVAMVLLGTTCSLRTGRQGGKAFLVATGSVLGFAFYVLRDITYALGQSGTIPLLLAAWTPLIISAMLGGTILLYLEDS